MRRLTLATLLTLTFTATLALAQAPPAPTATPVPPDPGIAVRNQALKELTAFQVGSARSVLEAKQSTLGSSPAFKTAWGMLRAEEGKLDEALTKLNEAATADTKDPAAEYYKGEVLRWQRKDGDAKASWQRAKDRAQTLVAKQAANAHALYYLGAAQVRLNENADARAKLEAAAQAGFDSGMVAYQIGLAYVNEKSWTAAKEALSRAITANPSLAHAYYYRGRVSRELKKTDEMMNDLDRFLKLAPNAPEASVARSLLAAGQG